MEAIDPAYARNRVGGREGNCPGRPADAFRPRGQKQQINRRLALCAICVYYGTLSGRRMHPVMRHWRSSTGLWTCHP